MVKAKICILENDPAYSRLLSDFLHLDKDLLIKTYTDSKSLAENLSINPSCVFLSAAEPGAEELAQRIHEYNSDIQMVLLCKPSELKLGKAFQPYGIREVLIKDTGFKSQAADIMFRLDYIFRLLKENTGLKQQSITEKSPKYRADNIISSEKNLQVFIRRYALNKQPVLLLSVFGAEPELLARRIHASSGRSASPFNAIDLREYPQEEVNLALFGNGRKPVTGKANTEGLLVSTNGGTLFIGNVDLLKVNIQEKIMRFFSTGTYRSRGKSEIATNVRFIFSTEKNPRSLLQEGKILPSFYDYLASTTYRILPLSERLQEIPWIADELIRDVCHQHHLPEKALSPKARAKLMMHFYPEDLSELKAILNRAIALSPTDVIHEDAVQFMEGFFNPDLAKGSKTPYEMKVRIVRHLLKVHNGKVSEVLKEFRIGRSSIYRMRDQGLVDF